MGPRPWLPFGSEREDNEPLSSDELDFEPTAFDQGSDVGLYLSLHEIYAPDCDRGDER